MTTELNLEVSSKFLFTKEYRKFEEFCYACSRDRYIGICYGTPGVGKTLSARQFAKVDLFEKLLSSDNLTTEQRTSYTKQVKATETLFYTVDVCNTPKQINTYLSIWLNHGITARYRANRTDYKLVIIDEADHLKVNSLEQIRAIYDKNNVGIILIGMPGMEKRLARYPQLYSRIGFAHEFKAIGEKDIYAVLEFYWQSLGFVFERENDDCKQAITSIVRATNGNFRLINRLFSQIKRILEINKLGKITKEVVEAACDCLVIGIS